jgi:hypothetical protein
VYKRQKYSVHDGKYYDFSFLDVPSGDDDCDGGE